ncbi:MAG: Asp-tRNA(Asn)/Glu-tRNA(Gln) amidotransferase subunit GatC [Acidobacteriota bacterium]
MKRITETDVDKLAKLAHLSLSDEEKENLAGELDKILAYAERIQSLGTEGVEPTSHALLRTDAFRKDDPRRGLPRQDVLGQAPDDGHGLFKVPKVIP